MILRRINSYFKITLKTAKKRLDLIFPSQFPKMKLPSIIKAINILTNLPARQKAPAKNRENNLKATQTRIFCPMLPRPIRKMMSHRQSLFGPSIRAVYTQSRY